MTKTLIHTSVNVLVTMEEVLFYIIWLVLIDMIIWTPWKQHNVVEQQNEANKRCNEANNKRHKKSVITKREALSEYCQIQKTIAKRINEHILKTNTTACKYLNYSRHVNLLLLK